MCEILLECLRHLGVDGRLALWLGLLDRGRGGSFGGGCIQSNMQGFNRHISLVLSQGKSECDVHMVQGLATQGVLGMRLAARGVQEMEADLGEEGHGRSAFL